MCISKKIAIISILILFLFIFTGANNVINVNRVSTGNYGGNSGTLRVMTYNICAGKGIDGKRDIERTLTVLKDSGASIISLNEVDRGVLRSGFTDQISVLADKLNLNFAFGKSTDILGGKYGNGILSKYPVKYEKSYQLPIANSSRDREPRSMLYCIIDYNGININVLSTHLSLSRKSRIEQIKFISGIIKDINGPILLLGDFNEDYTNNPAAADGIKPITSLLNDSASKASNGEKLYTFRVDNPQKKIDYIFASRDVKIINTEIIKTNASDHFPLYTDIVLGNK